MAPLTGIALASNWLINKLNQNPSTVKTPRMTTERLFSASYEKTTDLYIDLISSQNSVWSSLLQHFCINSSK